MRWNERRAVSSKWRTAEIFTVITAITFQFFGGVATSTACTPTLLLDRATATTLRFSKTCNEVQSNSTNFQYKRSSGTNWTSVEVSDKSKYYYAKDLIPYTSYDIRIMTSNVTITDGVFSTCQSHPPDVTGLRYEEKEGYLIISAVASSRENGQCNRFYKIRYKPSKLQNFTKWREFCFQKENSQLSLGSLNCTKYTSRNITLESGIKKERYYSIEIVTVRYGAENETSNITEMRVRVRPAPENITGTSEAGGLDVGNNRTQSTSTGRTPLASNPASSHNATELISVDKIPQIASKNVTPPIDNLAGESSQNAFQEETVSGSMWLVVVVMSAVLMALVAIPTVRCFSKRAKLTINDEFELSTLHGGRGYRTESDVIHATGEFQHANTSLSPKNALNSMTLKGSKENHLTASEVEYNCVYDHEPTRVESYVVPKNATIHRGTYKRDRYVTQKPGNIVLPPDEVIYENTLKKRYNTADHNLTLKIKPKALDDPEMAYVNILETREMHPNNKEGRPSESVLYENTMKDILPLESRIDSPSDSMDSSLFPSPEVREMIQDEASSFVYLNISNENPITYVNREQIYENVNKIRKH